MSVHDWLGQIIELSQLRVERIDFADCHDWGIEDGKIVHSSGEFFSVNAIKIHSNDKVWDGQCMLMIDQAELGWLGFVVRSDGKAGWEWLAQAKTEPGNIGGTQVAPTVQATRSNYRRVHGGSPTAYLDLMRKPSAILSDTAQSEQGDRFLWKFNRNSVIVGDTALQPIDERWKWLSSGDLRKLLGESFVLNTDARSIIATSPWHLLANGGALFKAPVLQRSLAHLSHSRTSLINMQRDYLSRVRMRWEGVPVNTLPGWNANGSVVDAAMRGNGVAFFQTNVSGREVDSWCQPFLIKSSEAHAVLLLRISNGRAEAFIRFRREVGLGNRAEFGPSAGPDEDRIAMSCGDQLKEIASIVQSDEGGRFMHSICRYSICLTEKPELVDAESGLWISIGALAELNRQSAATTNELRTLVSLLLGSTCDEALLDV